jgi:hypothetical protein
MKLFLGRLFVQRYFYATVSMELVLTCLSGVPKPSRKTAS